MCGIVGFQGDFSAALLDRMSMAVAHRGPDDAGRVLLPTCAPRGIVGFAHRRLSIVDLSPAGHQPMTARCPRCRCQELSDLALVYNGELYNHLVLRHELESRGHVFFSNTDSETLLHLYSEHGTGMLPMLNGIFAFAIRDGRVTGQPPGIERGDLFLARDQLGVKPLYYAQTEHGFLFASELKAILQDTRLPREIDRTALHYHLAYLWTPAPLTLIEGIRKLPPGHSLVVHGGRIINERAWYDIPYGRDPFCQTEREIALELHNRIEQAVSRQLMADVPVGAFLSGGLDSSAVVSMMRRVRPDEDFTAYCIGFAGNEAVEGNPADLPYATRVAKHAGIELRALQIQPSVISHLDRMLFYLDEPQADPAPINALLIAEQARRDGIPVLLAGTGGDDIFSGYRRHHALRVERTWGWLPQVVRDGMGCAGRSLSSGSNLGGLRTHALRRVMKVLASADLRGDERSISYFCWSTDALRQTLYSPALAEATGHTDVMAPMLESLSHISGERDPLNRMLYLEGKHFLADHNLNYTDKMGMAAGVEIRVPLLDVDLVDYATRIPSSMKQKGRTGKAIFKKAMEPDLPHDVIYRRKSGFGAPLRRWLRNELLATVDETLSPDALRTRGLFDPAAVQHLIALDRAGRVDGAYTIFALMCVELWSRQFLDHVPDPHEAALAAI